MDLQICKLTPELIPDYLYFFENVAHTDYKEWDRCYCLHYCSAHNAETNLSDPEKRREYAIEYINEGLLQGYLAYQNDPDGRRFVVGWVNANERDDCLFCDGWVEMTGNQKLPACGCGKTKSIFCFTVAPAMRGKHVATALLARVIEDAAADGYDTMEAYPDKTATDMYYNYVGPIKLYENFGFENVGEIGSHFIFRKKLKQKSI